tara:strand:- start:2370 stop:3758 length:1389 start_codon:yes stop_codon:yes gene_type:complete
MSNRVTVESIPNTATTIVAPGWGDSWKQNDFASSSEYYYFDATTDTFYKESRDAGTSGSSIVYSYATQSEIDKLLTTFETKTKIKELRNEWVAENGAYPERGFQIPDEENSSAYLNLEAVTGNPITIKERGEASGSTGSLRYPNDDNITKESDYVLFEFGEYLPPFYDLKQRANAGVPPGVDDSAVQIATGGSRYASYNESAVSFKPFEDDAKYRPIIMYMPQDVSTEYKTSWNAKAFSNVGRGVIAAANGDFDKLGDYNVPQGLRTAFASLFTQGVNSIPGIGGNISLDDVTGATRGVILNPNVEVLFDRPDLREFGLKFKMTPHDKKEAQVIRTICNTFKRASLPGFGSVGKRDWEKQSLAEELVDAGRSNDADDPAIGGGNFITIPHQCRVSFMKGGNRHPYLTQYKTCAITRVQVNYTPDGAYATYEDGSPVATELSLDFLETKLVFRDDITNSGPSL